MFEEEMLQVLEMAKSAFKMGFVSVAEGNFSVRIPGRDFFAITPSAIEYTEMSLEDIVIIDYNGEKIVGIEKPSSEWRLHAVIYKERKDVNAIVHTHSMYASVLSVMGEVIPVIIDEQVIYIKGDVRVSEYAMTGTWELAKNVLKALKDRRAALIKNHGLVAVGETPDVALNVAMITEKLAKIYYLAKIGGKVDLVPSDVIEKLKQAKYGKY